MSIIDRVPHSALLRVCRLAFFGCLGTALISYISGDYWFPLIMVVIAGAYGGAWLVAHDQAKRMR